MRKINYSSDAEREKLIQEAIANEEKLVEDVITFTEKYLVFESALTTEQILSKTIAQLTLDNTDLKQQLQTLAQTIVTMQLGGV